MIHKIKNPNISNKIIKHKKIKDTKISTIKTDIVNPYKGGIKIIQDIMDCPYRAMAIHRLKINNDIDTVDDSLNAKNKGIIIHKILADFWGNIKYSFTLKSMEDTKLKAYIQVLINKALKNFYNQNYKKILFIIEKNRLFKLLSKWIKYEMARSEDFEVLYIEKTFNVQILDFLFKVRLDRVDKLLNNKFMIIDYKTGQYKNNDLINVPMKKVQLPIYTYCIKSAELSIAEINDENTILHCLKNVDIKKLNFFKKGNNNKTKNYKELKHYWYNNLKLTINFFKKGNLILKPSIINCRNCNFSILCRNSEN